MKGLRSLTSNKSLKVSDEIVFNGTKCSDPLEISNNFNKFFVQSIIDINNQIPYSSNDININNTECSFKIIKIEMDDIEMDDG